MADWETSLSRLIAVTDSIDYGFGDAVLVSGINARQLRNGLDRGVFRLGKKLESVDRWVFSARDCLQLMVIGDLNGRAWVPVGRAAEIAMLLAQSLEFWMPKFIESISENHTRSTKAALYDVVAFSEDNETKVLMQQRGGEEPGWFNLDGLRLDSHNSLDAHIKLPALGILSRFAAGMQAVFAERTHSD